MDTDGGGEAMTVKPEDLKVGQIVKTSHPPMAVFQIESVDRSVIIGYRVSSDLSWVLRDWGQYVIKLSDVLEIVKQLEGVAK